MHLTDWLRKRTNLILPGSRKSIFDGSEQRNGPKKNGKSVNLVKTPNTLFHTNDKNLGPTRFSEEIERFGGRNDPLDSKFPQEKLSSDHEDSLDREHPVGGLSHSGSAGQNKGAPDVPREKYGRSRSSSHSKGNGEMPKDPSENKNNRSNVNTVDIFNDLPEHWVGREMKMHLVVDLECINAITSRVYEDVARGLVNAQISVKEIGHMCDMGLILNVSEGLDFPAAIAALKPTLSFLLMEVRYIALKEGRKNLDHQT